MSDTVAEQIARNNRYKHSHHTKADLEFCRNCGAFVNKPDPDNAGRVRYRCDACGHAILEHHTPPAKPRKQSH